MLVSKVVVQQRLLQFFTLAVRLVIDTESPFFLDGVTLVIEIVFCDRQALHPIKFEEESQVELVRRQDLEVVCTIFVCGAIHVAAVIEDEHKMFTCSNVLGSLEHHVFKKMRKTGAALAFVSRADIVSYRNRHYGR